MTRIQLALDGDLTSSLAVLHQVAELVDIVEVGTLLILREGLSAVGIARALTPHLPILADVRIAEAGGAIARLAYEAGASWVSMVASASAPTVREVCRCAREFGGEVQIELGEEPDLHKIPMWLDAGVQHVIVHRSRDAAQTTWTSQQIDRVTELADLGFTVTVTGGITVAEAAKLTHTAADILIVGRGIAGADSPRNAAAEFRAAVGIAAQSVP